MKAKKILACLAVLCLLAGVLKSTITTARADDEITVGTMAELENALCSAERGTSIFVSGKIDDFVVDRNITIPEDISLYFSGDISQVTVAQDASMDVDGALSVDGLMHIDGILRLGIHGSAEIHKGLTIAQSGRVENNSTVFTISVSGDYINNGTLLGNITYCYRVMSMEELEDALAKAIPGNDIFAMGFDIIPTENMTVPEGVLLYISRDIVSVTIPQNVTVTINGIVQTVIPVTVDGTLTLNGSGYFYKGLTIAEGGVVNNNGKMDISGGEFVNGGSLIGDGEFNNYFKPEDMNREQIAVDEINFPDQGFRSMISRFYDENNDGYVSRGTLAEVTELWACGPGIESLQGIQYFTNLEILHFGDNGDGKSTLRCIDVSGMTHLKKMTGPRNSVVYLNVTGCIALEDINVWRGYLTPAGLVGIEDTKVNIETIDFYGGGSVVEKEPGDINEDGKIDATDVTLLTRYVAKISPTLNG